MPGFQVVHEERWEPGPDGKLVKKIYTLKRELTDAQAEELFKAKVQQIEPIFGSMFGWVKPSKPSQRIPGSTPFDDMFKAINEFLGG
jgi:hypothetical protein